MFSCFPLDSFELQEMSCPTYKTWSHFPFVQHIMHDEHACDTIIFFLMLETEESISEIDSHHILQAASEL